VSKASIRINEPKVIKLLPLLRLIEDLLFDWGNGRIVSLAGSAVCKFSVSFSVAARNCSLAVDRFERNMALTLAP